MTRLEPTGDQIREARDGVAQRGWKRSNAAAHPWYPVGKRRADGALRRMREVPRIDEPSSLAAVLRVRRRGRKAAVDVQHMQDRARGSGRHRTRPGRCSSRLTALEGRMTAVDADLRGLLKDLSDAPASARIDLREPILAHGEPAIIGLEALVADQPDLAVSVISWLETLARRDERLRLKSIDALRRIGATCPPTGCRECLSGAREAGANPSRRPGPRPTSVPTAAGTEWTGFQAHEFGRNEGTGGDLRRSHQPGADPRARTSRPRP